jgi:hypothetical protein
MNFSTNQVRHFYLLKRENVFASGTGFTGKDALNNTLDPATTQAGDYSLRKLWDTTNSSITMDDKAFELMYQGKGGLTHSDIIRQKNIRKVNITAASDMERPLCKYQIQFKTFSQETSTIPGFNEESRNFYLNFDFPGFASLTPEETFTKTVVFEAVYNDASKTASNCKAAIDAAFEHEFAKFVTTSVAGTVITIEAVMPTRHNATAGLFELTGTDFILSNFTQEIVRENGVTTRLQKEYTTEDKTIDSTINAYYNTTDGKMYESLVSTTYSGEITPSASTIYTDLSTNKRYKWDVTTTAYVEDTSGSWVNVTSNNSNVLKNGAIIRDLEIFCMGDRGDNYRMKGWPNFVPTSYVITDDNGEYDILDIHYYYQGEGTNDDKSEKVLTLAMAHSGSSNTALTAIKTALLS